MDLLSSRMTCRIKWGGENDLKESDKSQIVVLHRVLGQNISKWGSFQSMKGGLKMEQLETGSRAAVARSASDVNSGMIWESLINDAIGHVFCTLIHRPALEPR